MNGLDQEFDVVIVGARVAGSPLATLLGDAGLRVLLVDRATFPSSTLSTHFFRGEYGVSVLDRLDVLDHALASGAPKLTCQYMYGGGSDRASVGPPQSPGEMGYCLSIRRDTLDDLLVRRAVASTNVTLMDRSRLLDLQREGDRVTGVTLQGPSGRMNIAASIVVGADGRHSTVAKLVDAPVEESSDPYRAMYYCYVRGYASPHGGQLDGPEFSFIDNEIAYVFPSDDGVTCVALSIEIADYAQFRHDAERNFRERIARHRGFADRFAASTWVDRLWGCGPEPGWVRRPIGPGWALVGDAGLHMDPWGGHGIDMATVHGTMLAEAIIAWFASGRRDDAPFHTYHERRNLDGIERYRFTSTFAEDLRPLSDAD